VTPLERPDDIFGHEISSRADAIPDGLLARVALEAERDALRVLPRTRAEQVALLRAVITASGLSTTRWAATIAGRDPRTVQRWLAGRVIPGAALRWLLAQPR